jgi:hypothetical protein
MMGSAFYMRFFTTKKWEFTEHPLKTPEKMAFIYVKAYRSFVIIYGRSSVTKLLRQALNAGRQAACFEM